MAMADRAEVTRREKTELSFLVRTLQDVYGSDDKLEQSVRRHAVLGCDMAELREAPDKVLSVFLPIILSYGEDNTGIARMYNGEHSRFKNTVDALLENGVEEFYQELRRVN